MSHVSVCDYILVCVPVMCVCVCVSACVCMSEKNTEVKGKAMDKGHSLWEEI